MPTLWNHTLDGSYPACELNGIPGVWRYGARALSCTKPGDTIQLHADLDAEFPWVSDHYRRIGLPHAQNVVWDAGLGRAAEFPGHDWEVFLFSGSHHEVRPNRPWVDAARRMNNKNHFLRECEGLGVPIPDTTYFDCPTSVNGHLSSLTYPVYRKTACSASGAGVVFCKDDTELRADLDGLPTATEFQLQRPVQDARTFLNVQYTVDQLGTLKRIGLTEQVLDGFAHAGNRFPTKYGEEVWRICDPAAKAIARMGMQGVFAFDVAIEGSGKPIMIECNPRWNACTYYYKVAELLHATHWMCRNLKVRWSRLGEINIDGIEYNSRTRSGAIIVSWGTILDHKVGVLYIGSSDSDCDRLHSLFLERNGAMKH